MPVTIGDFEVVPQAPTPMPEGAPISTPAARMDPLDLQTLLEELNERALRLMAD